MNALVTGASGFLGLYVVEQLVARGDRVRAMCRGNDPRLDSLGVEIVHADLRDRTAVVRACQTVDVVFHVGGIAGMNGPWRPYYETNVLGTAHVIDGCRTHGVGRLVYTSSPSVTFDGRDQNGVDESMPYPKRWLCHYARSKGLAEQQVLAANGRDGLRTCALRPHLIWGPRDRHLLPTILDRARIGRLGRVGDGTNLVDTSYVENVATAHVQAADALRPGSPVAGRAYFISQGDPVNCWQWINQVVTMAGLPPIQKTISRRAAWWVGAGCETLYWLLQRKSEPPMSRFLAAELSSSHFFDIRRAQKDFGYEPKISTAEGLQRLAASWTTTS
ncbi:MAG: NAD-dependent epimerase/dehydratase family protein [Planctomycetaceae bacterium]|nr:NAD-dependent epimerase/dehydratase family protein [Planctomycetaceae bacterium]